jgi:hypothetical protein
VAAQSQDGQGNITVWERQMIKAVIAPDFRLRHIYGVFVNDRCIYVGQTIHLGKRAATHRERFSEILGIEPEIKVFAVLTPDIADQFEAAEIQSRKKIGEAEYNRAVHVKTKKSAYLGDEVYCVETGEIFDSKNLLASALGLCSVTHIFRRYGGKYFAYTFIEMAHMTDAEYHAAYDRAPTGRLLRLEAKDTVQACYVADRQNFERERDAKKRAAQERAQSG